MIKALVVAAVVTTGGVVYAANSATAGSTPQVVEHHEGHWVVETDCKVESDCFPAWDGDSWTINWDPS